jgi:hypothetical protein
LNHKAIFSSAIEHLFFPQRLAQIDDTPTESGAARVDAHIGTGQTFLRQSGSIGALGATRREERR